jgi:4-phospho-D-threonate 3-dehydrogenase / 4-phospho-D-erythronate 3-dehydrogenase
MSARPRIAITMGDPAGVGPELCLRLADNGIIYGDLLLLNRVADHIGMSRLPADRVKQVGVLGDVIPGQISAACGSASFQYVEAAIQDALAGRIDAICTLPISKESWHAAGITYLGHTELLADRCGVKRQCMMLTSDAITASLVTVHVGYAEVPKLLTIEKILDTIELTAATMRSLRGHEPRLTVCGLNPHAGEHGLFGMKEEETIIIPAVEQARLRGYLVEGPLPADTAFIPSRRQQTDAYICMYHDQGLIPLKALAFDSAVNVTLGLPIARTSPDHGTAFDIAWQGKADASSARAAVLMAARLAGK